MARRFFYDLFTLLREKYDAGDLVSVAVTDRGRDVGNAAYGKGLDARQRIRVSVDATDGCAECVVASNNNRETGHLRGLSTRHER